MLTFPDFSKPFGKRFSIRHCPTGEMLSDHFTKPLHGGLLRKCRADIKGILIGQNETEMGRDSMPKSEQNNKGINNPSPQECVGRSLKSPARFLRNRLTKCSACRRFPAAREMIIRER
jgi:hypothetical protein